ncbi:MAG: hypothetical protein ACK55Z_10945, partial [bacterium]
SLTLFCLISMRLRSSSDLSVHGMLMTQLHDWHEPHASAPCCDANLPPTCPAAPSDDNFINQFGRFGSTVPTRVSAWVQGVEDFPATLSGKS